MSLRTVIRRLLEGGQSPAAIVAELRCSPVTITKVQEQLAFEYEIVDEPERQRRARVSSLSSNALRELAFEAEIDAVTLRRALMCLRVRASSLAIISRALARRGLLDLLPIGLGERPAEGSH